MDEEVRRTDYGDDTQDVESHAASALFDAHTGERLKRAAKIVAIVFGVAFVLVSVDRLLKARSVARAAQEAASAPPPVEVITAQAVGAVQRLVLPGYTAAWHASTIYARVDGYVAKWFVDIGDHVQTGRCWPSSRPPISMRS